MSGTSVGKSQVPAHGKDSSLSRRRKDMFGDCALVEIIHLHDCLRGALKALQQDVTELSQSAMQGSQEVSKVSELERRVAGRFNVIWSVFRAHSEAEDEFIWPALKLKTGRFLGSPKYNPATHNEASNDDGNDTSHHHQHDQPNIVEQEEYAEDHADEERMFRTMDSLLSKLRTGLVNSQRITHKNNSPAKSPPTPTTESVPDMAREIHEQTASLMQHLMQHLDKEETQCMPLVVKHLTKDEIHDLVGQIMGKRSSETIAKIMTMAVQNLDEADREEMVCYMKQAMVGTFFEKWLAMSGWMSSSGAAAASKMQPDKEDKKRAEKKTSDSKRAAELCKVCPNSKRMKTDLVVQTNAFGVATSQTELEKLIRVVASNRELSAAQKNTTIQGLRDSVWKSNLRHRNMNLTQTIATHSSFPASAGVQGQSRTLRDTPPSAYYEKTANGKVELVWTRTWGSLLAETKEIPKFTPSELAPTFHDGANGGVLGCPHYARSCKLRHPTSGRLYTCRLCCEQERENPLKEQDSPLDRYAVSEVFCMKCGTLQPASDGCINPECESKGAPFAKYCCRICNLYDDNPEKNIYHCPFCNVCRSGRGLGIDYRHCMRCNACVSLQDDDHHCIPHRLQGSCPICNESMFQSTEPLRGLKCGHVMHLSCFNMYRRGQSYTCPLCKKSMEDMKEYFSMLDTAVRMQPMPSAYSATVSNIYCQDCGKSSEVSYHFVGCKCSHCGSYNTRELGRRQRYHATTK